MTQEIYMRLIEEISLNAWPSYKTELYDGWLIRFSHNYTHRTNSVEQVGISQLPVEEKISYCESIYAGYRTPVHFKINPLMDPSFDKRLEKRGYVIQHTTEVMTMAMTNFCEYHPDTIQDKPIVQFQNQITDHWIHAVFCLNGTTDLTLRRIVPSMFKAIPKETIATFIEDGGRIVALGLGILDRGHIGLYAIYVEAGYRHRNYARSICSAILEEAHKRGAVNAYLQVVQGNAAAKELYKSLGFTDFYTYWFRTLECVGLYQPL